MTHKSTEAADRVYQAMLKLQAEQPPRGVPLKEIAEEAGLTHKGTVSNYIKRLVEAGLVVDLGGGRGRYRALTQVEIDVRSVKAAMAAHAEGETLAWEDVKAAISDE